MSTNTSQTLLGDFIIAQDNYDLICDSWRTCAIAHLSLFDGQELHIKSDELFFDIHRLFVSFFEPQLAALALPHLATPSITSITCRVIDEEMLSLHRIEFEATILREYVVVNFPIDLFLKMLRSHLISSVFQTKFPLNTMEIFCADNDQPIVLSKAFYMVWFPKHVTVDLNLRQFKTSMSVDITLDHLSFIFLARGSFLRQLGFVLIGMAPVECSFEYETNLDRLRDVFSPCCQTFGDTKIEVFCPHLSCPKPYAVCASKSRIRCGYKLHHNLFHSNQTIAIKSGKKKNSLVHICVMCEFKGSDKQKVLEHSSLAHSTFMGICEFCGKRSPSRAVHSSHVLNCKIKQMRPFSTKLKVPRPPLAAPPPDSTSSE